MKQVQRLGHVTRRHLRLVRTEGLPRSLPATRGECAGHEGPCAYVSCRHHLALDATYAGAVVLRWNPEEEPDRPTCALDVVDATGGLGFDEIGKILGCTRERVRQIHDKAIGKIAPLMEQEE